MAATVASRFKALREALGLPHHGFDGMRGEKIARTEVVKVESGDNKLTGRLREKLARAMGVSTDELAAYIEGRSTLPDILRAVSLPQQGAVTHRERPAPPADWFKVDPETKVQALLLLRQPPQKFEQAALDLAFSRLRIRDPEAAKDPSQVADFVRAFIWGIAATLPGQQPVPSGTGRSERKSG